MNNIHFKLTTMIFCCLVCLSAFSQKTYSYPAAPRDSITNEYFGDVISDPYQWMENPEDVRLKNWIEEQGKLTKKQTSKNTHVWDLRAQLVSMYHDVKEKNTDSYIEEKEGNLSKYLFEYHIPGYSRSFNLRFRKRGPTNFITLVNARDFKSNKADNAFVSDYFVNPDESHVAVFISHSGSDWRDVFFYELSTGKRLDDTLKYLRGDHLVWDDEGVYYDRYDKPKEGRELLDKATGQALYFHKLGTSQSDDKMLFQNPDQTGTNDFGYFEESDKLFVYHYYSTKGNIYKALSFSEMNNGESFYLKNFLIYPNGESISIEELFGDTLVLSTTWNAPNKKVLVANINEQNKLVPIVPEYDVPLREVNRFGKQIACVYRSGGQDMVLIFDLNGTLLNKIDFPAGKKVRGFYEDDPEAAYTNFYVSSFYHPSLRYQISLTDFTFKPSEAVWVPYKPEDLETRYVQYKSKDGTEIPMYITCQKDIDLNGKNPTLIYGYGGYGHTVEPSFDESETLWLLHGGVLAVPNVRGGGAGGSEWGKAGRKLNKQNAIDDFVAAAEYLINAKYTNPKKIAINGRSHGGLLISSALTQRPELFKSAIIEAGAMDMLRFEQFTVGSANTNLNEFGTVSDSTEYVNLRKYSPLHNIKKGVTYPNTLLITGEKDDRVPPLHTYKFLATLQEKGDPSGLYHLYLVPGSGHGGALTQKDFEEGLLYKYYFLFDQLGVKFW